MNDLSQDECGELFNAEPSYLPRMQDGETLFSWAARYHRLSGNSLAKQSSLQLFEDGRAGLRLDFPSHLDRFVEITKAQFGDAETLAYERTVFGYFSAFQDRDGCKTVLSHMRGGSVEKVKSVLGLLPSRVGGFFPLKACPDCIRKDKRDGYFSKWYLEHQWPSVWICRTHGVLLKALRRESQPKDLRKWMLPEDVAQYEWTELPVNFASVKSRLFKIAQISAEIAQQRDLALDTQLLRYVYLLQAKKRGWLSTDGSLKLIEVRQAFQKYCNGLDLPGFAFADSARAEQGGVLGLLMRRYAYRRHPVKHILLVSFLFESIDAFNSSYKCVQEARVKGGFAALDKMIGESWRTELKRLIEVDQMSLSAAARVIAIPLSVVIRVAKQDGIAYKKKPHVVNTELGDHILKMISEGLSREEILQKSGVKKTLLKDLMARVPKLRDEWKRLDFQRRREAYRANFLALAQQYRGVPVKRLRLVPGNGVSWLYRCDREWFVENLPRVE